MLRRSAFAVLLLLSAASACSKKQENDKPVDTTLPDDEAPAPTPSQTQTQTAADEAEPNDYGEAANSNPYGEPDSYEGDGEEEANPPDVQAPVQDDADHGVRPRGNPGSWITDADYPQGALREDREGIANFRVTVGTDGRVADCQITSSSGSPDLDEATCANVSRRARFVPAMQDGAPVEGTYSNRIRWVIPE